MILTGIAAYIVIMILLALFIGAAVRLRETGGRDPKDCRPRDGME